jgi:hypothetical protein
MLVPKLSRSLPGPFVFVALGAFVFASCASKPEPQLISDNTGRESSLPWNQQERWEQTGQYGDMADALETR